LKKLRSFIKKNLSCAVAITNHHSRSDKRVATQQVKQGFLKSLAVALPVSLVLFSASSNVQAKAKPLKTPVSNYPLQCDETFSCPNSIRLRVGFWVEVFSRWDTNTAVFHDKEHPSRVFATLNRKDGCRNSRRDKVIDKERKALKAKLETLASRLDKGRSLSKSQLELKALFVGEGSKEIRAASNRIRCQSGNSDRMREALAQFQHYRPTILDALESENLTPELQYLPFVESAFNPQALSHVGAAGLWQIMPATGRRLGLMVDDRVDQRYDPRDATYAAAAYFRDSVDKLSSAAFNKGSAVNSKDLNPFVITSYNYGVRGMERAIAQVGLDYERLLAEYKSPSFQTAVKNFYASFLAARHVAKNVDTFFGTVAPAKSQRIHSFNTVKLKRNTSAKRLSKSLGIKVDVLKELNPALRRVIWEHKALIPKDYQMRVSYKENGWQSALTAMNSLPHEIEHTGYKWHRVKSGQTACKIAESNGVSCRALFKLNKLDKKGTIYVGKKIKVPTKTGGISIAKSKGGASQVFYEHSVGSLGASISSEYKVKRGDTACSIADKHKMSCSEFLAINGLQRDSIIVSGHKLRVVTSHQWHKVSRGEGACKIAEKYGVGCSKLLKANGLNKKSVLHIGKRLRIPTAG